MEGFMSIKRSKLSNTELIAATTIGMPFHYFMEEDDFSLIHSVLRKLV